MSTSIDKQVAANLDDVYIYYTTAGGWGIATGGSFNRIGRVSTTSMAYEGGFRFTDITIPDGSTIDVAYLSFYDYGGQSGTTCNGKIRGEANINAAQFSDYADYIGRTLLDTVVTWYSIPAWSDNTWYNTADFASIIQELVDENSGLSSANIVIFAGDRDMQSSSGAYRAYDVYDAAPSTCVKLHIEYTAAGGGWSNIAKVRGVTASDIAKINGVAVDDIAKLRGVAV